MKKFMLTTALATMLGTTGIAETITLGTHYESITQLDPHVSTKAADKMVFGMMFNGLVRFAPGSISADDIEPDLAESWDRSEDGLTWTFKLREGVQFHGEYGELTAADVVYSLERAADPDRSGVSSDYSEVSSITALDDYTVEINLSQPIPSLLGIVANYHGGNIVSMAAAEELGENFKGQPIGTGPYEFVELVDGQYLTLAAHEEYFRGTPEIEEVSIRFLPSDSSRELAFRNGELDVFSGTREDRWIDRVSNDDGAIIDIFQPGELRTLHLNQTVEQFQDIRVRQAVAHALNRDELVQFMGAQVANPNASPVPTGYLGHDETIEGFAYDPERARELLTEAGYPDGFSVKAIVTELPALLTPMQVIQEQLRAVGIELELEVTEHSAWHTAIRDDASAVVLYGAARFPVADTYLTQFYHSDSTVKTPTAITNFSHCSAADEQITAARSEANSERQLELWAEAQAAIVEDVCSVPLFELLQVWAHSPNVDYGYELNGTLSLSPFINETTTKTQ